MYTYLLKHQLFWKNNLQLQFLHQLVTKDFYLRGDSPRRNFRGIFRTSEKLGNYKLVRHLRETIKASPHRQG